MAISTYSELQTAVSDFMDRADVAGNVVDFITLAEARLNRLLKVIETDATLTGVADSRRIDISSLSITVPIALFCVVDGDEEPVVQKADGDFAYSETSFQPSFWAIDGTNIDFNCPLDQAYTFRLRYQGRFALSVAAPTNDLLTKHPDIYLSAAIVWGGMFVRDSGLIGDYKTMLDEFIFETKNTLRQKKRSVLTVDPALTATAYGAWQYR